VRDEGRRVIGRVRAALTPVEWARAGGLAAAVIALHVVGFGLLFGVVVPHHFSLGAGGAFTAGVGLTAYTLGLRHAFDADHIAAIDNTTRKLMNDGQRPLGVGFFFSLGHSTVVFALALLFALGVRALAGQVQDDGSTLHSATGLIGTGISGAFLYCCERRANRSRTPRRLSTAASRGAGERADRRHTPLSLDDAVQAASRDRVPARRPRRRSAKLV
jgi:high-affinity nickel permease